MTLILSQASYGFVLQVSDRRITQAEDGKLFDPISNKSILYSAPDAVVSMAYTGVAYLDGIPTDQWLAEQITGKRLPPGPSPANPTMLCSGKLPQWLHIGPTLKLIAERLTTAFASRRMKKKARDMMFELLVVGWQWSRRNRERPIVVHIRKEEGSSGIDLLREGRHFGRKFLFGGTPEENLDPPDKAYLRDGLSKVRSADEAETVLVNTI